MEVEGIEIPSGLMRGKIMNPQNHSIENVYTRMRLEEAVEKADLNVTERLALNQKFFPNGGGFDLFPENKHSYRINHFYNRLGSPETDTFIKQADSLEKPDHVCRITKRFYPSSEDSFNTNLKLALKKLKKAIINN